jgi:hypothetical protein
MKYRCSCPVGSPFHWPDEPRASIFAKDPAYRAASTTGMSQSQASTQVVEQVRKKGEVAGFLRGISRKREEEILRIRNFMTYAMAKPLKGGKDEVEGEKRDSLGVGGTKRGDRGRDQKG